MKTVVSLFTATLLKSSNLCPGLQYYMDVYLLFFSAFMLLIGWQVWHLIWKACWSFSQTWPKVN